ncbi:MAG: hypothetical protein HUK03_10060 [Bacteroidaceae bacterium]|nr:hypothetical protein [Bacteroidaceae bacterium]
MSYTRNFTSTNWQALYVPFAMKYEEWKDYADVAYINNVHQWDDDDDGVIDRTRLEFITVKSGSIKANTPYVIKPKQVGEVTFTAENTTLKAAPAVDGSVDCSSTSTKYTLSGTYTEKTDMYEKGYYGMSNGDFYKAADPSVTLKPNRIYLKIESRKGGMMELSMPNLIHVMVDGIADDEANAIEGVQATDAQTQHGQGYNISGQKVAQGYKGIVIVNGKKVLMK